MNNNQEISLDQYRGSEVMKGFEGNPLNVMEQTVKNNFQKGLIDKDTFEKAMFELDIIKGKDPEKQKKVQKVMEEFKAGTLKGSDSKVITDKKQALAVAMSEAGMSKKAEISEEEDEEKKKKEEVEKAKKIKKDEGTDSDDDGGGDDM